MMYTPARAAHCFTKHTRMYVADMNALSFAQLYTILPSLYVANRMLDRRQVCVMRKNLVCVFENCAMHLADENPRALARKAALGFIWAARSMSNRPVMD